MNNLLLLVSLSLSASIIALPLFALKPVYRNRLSKTWQYYIWLVVVVRLLLPFAPEANLMGYLFQHAEQSAATVTQPENPQEIRPDVPAYPVPNDGAAISEVSDAPMITETPRTAAVQIKSFLEQNLFTIWLVAALALFVRKLTSYHSFVRYISAGSHEVNQAEILDAYFTACEESGISKPLPICENKLVSSPMLVGMLRPCIVLPELQLNTESLRLLLRHELIHHKRRDILYKWLVQLALCIHWFNPLAYLVGREVNRNCELSCDEAVISRMADDNKRQYGDTLLASLKSGGGYGNAVASITLTEDGKNLKERLQAILKHHSGSVWTKAAAVVLSVVILCGASFAGAYAGAKRASAPESDIRPASQPVAGQMAEQKAAAPIIMKQGEYVHIITAAQGSTHSVPFQAGGKQTALYVHHEGEGKFTFTLTVRNQSGDIVLKREGAAITEDVWQAGSVGTFSTDPNKVYSLELSVPTDGPASVAVYGAGMDRANEYTGITLPDVPSVAGSLGGKIAKEVTDWTLDYTLGNIDQWAENWGQKWSGSFGSYNGESWRYLKYLYEDGYLVGVGIRNNDLRANYLLKTITLDGKTYTLSYPAAAAEYADNARVKDLITKILTDHALWNGGGAQDNDYFTVRSVAYNTDPQDLLRSLYRDKAFVEFIAVVGHCKGLPVIEELLNKAADDQEGMYFMFLADQLPDNFSLANAEALARKAVNNRDIVMLSALERFLPDSLYESLMKEALELDNIDFNFDYDYNKE